MAGTSSAMGLQGDFSIFVRFIKNHCNATIVCGHDIGEFAFIGAGAVVTKHVPAYALMVGNPARQMGWMSEFGQRLEFDNTGFATCQESGSTYQLINNTVKKIK